MEHVCKSYKIAKRNAGFQEALKALFHREYEEISALNDVSFTIQDGEMVGYIGPNGAGKSSTSDILPHLKRWGLPFAHGEQSVLVR